MTEIETNEAKNIINGLQDVFNIILPENFKKTMDEAKKADEKAASSGYYSTAASSGNYSKAASSGDSSKAASSGNSSTAASSGNYSTAASSGNSSKAASSGNSSKAASSGNYSTAASSGNSSTAASSGNYSTAASSGNYSKAEATGENVCAFACGTKSMAKASKGGGIALSEYSEDGKKLLSVKASIIDGNKLLADEWYRLEGGEFTHVDFSDGVFSHVKSIKKLGGATVKTVIIDGKKKKSYIYISGGKSAHGETIEKAKADLRFKISDRDTTKFKTWKVTDEKMLDEVIEAYRIITGACEQGTRNFVESQGELPKKMTVADVISRTKGAFGNEKFSEFFKDKK